MVLISNRTHYTIQVNIPTYLSSYKILKQTQQFSKKSIKFFWIPFETRNKLNYHNEI